MKLLLALTAITAPGEYFPLSPPSLKVLKRHLLQSVEVPLVAHALPPVALLVGDFDSIFA
jgi:hypothetical protein